MMSFSKDQNRGCDETDKNGIVPIRKFYVSPIEKHVSFLIVFHEFSY